MPKRNRSYKKGEPHRDARLFVIVAEGEREDSYFTWFNSRNQRIRIKIVPREENRSAPNFFLDRVHSFIESGGWSPQDGDRLWFVLDVDRWSREEIDNLRIACEQEGNWNIAISNPCFEVWILYHQLSSLRDNGENCTNLKQIIPQVIRGGFNVDVLCPLIKTAMENARIADTNEGSYPDRMHTKVYRLAEQLLELLGNNRQ